MPSTISRRSWLGACASFGLAAFAINATDVPIRLSPVGRWRTVDDKTGKPRSIVRIWEENGKFFGRVEQSLNPERAGRRCDKCTDERKDQLIVGMTIIRNLRQDGDEYSGGDIVDPDNGKIYRCKLSLKEHGNILSVRGYLGASLFGRTQTWKREPEESGSLDRK